MRDLRNFKICFLAGTLEHGGAERQLFLMLRALCQQGAIPHVLSLDRGEFWEKPIQSLGVPVTWAGQSRSRLARFMKILKELRANPPDLLQCQHFFANAYAGLASRVLKLPAIGAIRNEGEAELMKNGVLGGWLNLRTPRFIAANSGVAIQQAIARGISRSRLYFLPNVVDTRLFKPSARPTAGPVTVLSVGRIVREKGFDRFISALGRLRSERNLDVRGWIAGPVQDTGVQKELEKLGKRLGLIPNYLRFLGGVSKMAPLYQRADLCVLTSDFEGTPNVLLEAMASGLPVVATKVGGVPEIVQEGVTGVLVERNNREGLLAALADLVANLPRRLVMGRQAREFVDTNHSVERLSSYLASLYDAVMPRQDIWKLGVAENYPV